jgi:hypothetical protein
MWLHTFAVDGSGAFPLDMLRYDGCYPKTGDDAGKLETDYRDRRSLTLCHYGDRYWTPTAGRWSSFCWSVVDHVSEPA